MANIVSELFISLGLDSSNFSKGMDDAEKKMGQMGETSKRVGDDLRKGITFSLGEVVKAAFPLLGVTASVMSLVNAQQSLYNIQKASKETGIPAREYAAWGRAAESLGYSAQDAQGSLASLQSALQEAALTGRSQAAGVLVYLGVGLFKANGQMKSATEVLKDLSRVMSRLPIEKARIYGLMMGLSPSTIALLREGKNLTAELANQLENGITEEQAKRAWEMQKAWNQLKQSGMDLAYAVLQTLSPAIETFLKIAKAVSSFFADHSTLISYAASAMIVVKAIGMAVTAFMSLGKAVAGAFALITAAMRANPILAMISLLIAGVFDLINFFKGADSVIGSLFEAVGIKADRVKAVFKAIGEVLLTVFKPIGFLINAISGLMMPQEMDEQTARANLKQNTSAMSVAPSVIHNNSRSGVVNNHVENTVNIDAPGGNPKVSQKAAQDGIASGMNGYKSMTAYAETGYSY